MVVITTNAIKKGTVFGPIPKTVTLADPAVLIGYRTSDTYPDIHTVKLDLTKHINGNTLAEWIPYVQSARNSEEQNFEAYSEKDKVFYVACKHVPANCEVFVWYEEHYAKSLGVPQVESDYIKNNFYHCPHCQERFLYPNCLRTHMKFKCKQNVYLKSNSSCKEWPSHLVSMFQNDGNFFKSEEMPDCPNLFKPTFKRKLTEQENNETNIKKCCESHIKLGREQTQYEFQKCSSNGFSDNAKSNVRIDSVEATPTMHSHLNSTEDHFSFMHRHALMFFQNFHHQLRNPLSSLEMVNFLNNSSAFTIINSPTIFVNQPSSIINKYQNLLHPYNELSLTGNETSAAFGVDNIFSNRKMSHTLVESQISPALPSTFAALTLTQNWCAKCNTSFRMTSDLVYHMRSHHKRDFDPVKKRKDDKLKCEVCGESFRERHHLTRHMTSHA